MSFTISDFREWARILREHPEWRDEARRLILSDELLELPLQVREVKERVDLVYEAQQRLEGRVDRLETALIELAEAQKRAEERLAGVEERLAGVEERVARLEIA
ncbi:MAG: hypothetical protein N3D16_11800, partial [Anaerolineales bacterium]|nr:hypothetical protein [Anaerolineales bacterium]